MTGRNGAEVLKDHLSELIQRFAGAKVAADGAALGQVWLLDGAYKPPVLTTKDLPYCVVGSGDALVLFRLESATLTFPVDPGNPAGLGAPGRVCLLGSAEMSDNLDVQNATTYERVHLARKCGVQFTALLPLYIGQSARYPVAVFECAATRKTNAAAVIDVMRECILGSRLHTNHVAATSMEHHWMTVLRTASALQQWQAAQVAQAKALAQQQLGLAEQLCWQATAMRGGSDNAFLREGGSTLCLQRPQELVAMPDKANGVMRLVPMPRGSLMVANHAPSLIKATMLQTNGTAELAGPAPPPPVPGRSGPSVGSSSGTSAAPRCSSPRDPSAPLPVECSATVGAKPPTPSPGRTDLTWGGAGADGVHVAGPDGRSEGSPSTSELRTDGDEESRGGQRGSRGDGLSLSHQSLQPHFGRPLKEAAKALGVCPTTLKRACRRLGLLKWPRRELMTVRRKGGSNSSDSGQLATSQAPSQSVVTHVSASLTAPQQIEAPDAWLPPSLHSAGSATLDALPGVAHLPREVPPALPPATLACLPAHLPLPGQPCGGLSALHGLQIPHMSAFAYDDDGDDSDLFGVVPKSEGELEHGLMPEQAPGALLRSDSFLRLWPGEGDTSAPLPPPLGLDNDLFALMQ